MAKSGKKRGRPGIKPWIEALIAKRVIAERKKPPEERMPVKVLANEIRKDIIGGNERAPEISTLERRILNYSKKSSPEDEPWTIFTLDRHPIPLEALPKVLKQYREVKDFCGLSIREAKWIARLSSIEPPERDPWLYALVASIEQLFEMVGSPPNFHLIDDILAASVANDREAENEALDCCLAWFGTETIRLSLGELKQAKSRNQKKDKGGTK
jgi:hypothetical protein